MLTLAILCGGQSSRMGQDKALMPFLDRPLIQRVVDRLSPLASEVIISASDPAKYSYLGFPIHQDIYPDCGSLGGLYTSLVFAGNPLVAAVACDLPFANRNLFAHEVELISDSYSDVVIPLTLNGLEPLHAVYRREACLPVIKKALDAGNLKMIDWFVGMKVIEIPPSDILKFDPKGLAFWNLNTPEEFASAEEYILRLDKKKTKTHY
jgi:molybdopterin-guanine dinucleotide biosynthesis protein A